MNNNSLSCRSKDVSGPISPLGADKPDTADTVVWGKHLPEETDFSHETTLVREAAHDFKNILYVIRGFAQLVLGVVDKGSKTHTHIRIILDAVERGNRLAGHILALAQPTEPEKHPIDIIPVVEETLSFVRASVPENVCVRLTVSEDMGPMLANPTEIHQLLVNLCSNAAQAMQDSGGILDVSVERVEMDDCVIDRDAALKPGPYLRLTVSDSGEGMEPAVADRIFQPYFTTKEKGQGTGLGLCVVQRIVKGHGGCLTVESASGKGTTCQVYFPTVECASPSCSSGRVPPCRSTRREFGRGLLRDGVHPLRTYVRNIRGDIEHLEKELEQYEVEFTAILADLRTHVRELELHLHEAFAQVPHAGTGDYPVP